MVTYRVTTYVIIKQFEPKFRSGSAAEDGNGWKRGLNDIRVQSALFQNLCDFRFAPVIADCKLLRTSS